MAALSSSDPALSGIPAEIRIIIFEHLFADYNCEIAEREGYYYFVDIWPVAILETCSLFHREAKTAMRARFSECSLDYEDKLPPAPGFPNEPEGRHRTFLRQYGHCFQEVSTCYKAGKNYHDGMDVEWSPTPRIGLPLGWFPNLQVFEYIEPILHLENTGHDFKDPWEPDEPDLVLVDGKLNKHRLLALFQTRYYGKFRCFRRLPPDVVDLINDRHRTFSIQISFRLHITYGPSYTISGRDYGIWDIEVNTDTWNVRYREIEIVYDRSDIWKTSGHGYIHEWKTFEYTDEDLAEWDTRVAKLIPDWL